MTSKEIKDITLESLRDWFKKEKWVRISSSGNIAGPCGTSKNKKNPDRCLPRAKAQSLTKGQRAATAAKKKKAGAKGKTVVKNTKKATVKKEDYAPLNLTYKKGYKDLRGLFLKITTSSDIETIKKLSHVFVDNLKKASKIQRAKYKKDIQNGNKNSIFSLITNLFMNDSRMTSGLSKETKEAPKGHYFTKSGNLVKGRMSKDAKERGARKSDPKDKQRSKVPKATQYTETANPQDGKAAPYGSGYKKVTKEDIKNLVVGLLNEKNVDLVAEKDDRCTRLAKQKYDTWPSAYASGAVVRCRRGEIWKKK